MPTPFASWQPAASSWINELKPKPITSNPEWRCRGCGKLLGVVRREKLNVRQASGHDYLVSFPVEVTCGHCGKFQCRSNPNTQ